MFITQSAKNRKTFVVPAQAGTQDPELLIVGWRVIPAQVQWKGHKLGYVPRVEDHAVAQLLDESEHLEARITRLQEHWNPWERVEFEVYLRISL